MTGLGTTKLIAQHALRMNGDSMLYNAADHDEFVLQWFSSRSEFAGDTRH